MRLLSPINRPSTASSRLLSGVWTLGVDLEYTKLYVVVVMVVAGVVAVHSSSRVV